MGHSKYVGIDMHGNKTIHDLVKNRKTSIITAILRERQPRSLSISLILPHQEYLLVTHPAALLSNISILGIFCLVKGFQIVEAYLNWGRIGVL